MPRLIEPFKTRFRSETRLYDFLPYEPSAFINVGIGDGAEWLRFYDRYPGKPILGLEPNPVWYKALIEGTACWAPRGDKPYPGTLLPHAAWDSHRMLVLEGKRNMTKTREHGKGHVVNAFRLDHLIDDSYGGDMILWADCEGSELRAFKGCDLSRVMLINVEVRSYALAKQHGIECWDEQVYDYLEGQGFRVVCEYRSMRSNRHRDAILVRAD